MFLAAIPKLSAPRLICNNDQRFSNTASANLTGYDLLEDDFGLLDKSATNWQNLTTYINQLNQEADTNTTYKLIYVARHGEGFHNVAEAKYGTPAWDDVC